VRTNADGGGCFPTGRHYPAIAHLLRAEAIGLAEEFGGDHSITDLSVVAIDTETTGRDPSVDRIVEVACVVWRGSDVHARRSWLVDPERPIPEEVRAVHGISDDDVRGKPRFSEIVPELLEALRDAVPLAYNAEFDRGFLMAELARAGIGPMGAPPAARRSVEWLDPLVWARELQKQEKSKALSDVCARLDIRLEQAHRATQDAEAALRVLRTFLDEPRVPKRYGAFIQEQRRLARSHEDERRHWRRGTKTGPNPGSTGE